MVCACYGSEKMATEKIHVAIAFIYKETADNSEWFFASCIVAGINMHDRARLQIEINSKFD